MRRWLLLAVGLCPLAVAVLLGCETMFQQPSPGGADGDAAEDFTTQTTTSGSSTEGGGDFIEVGGDVVDRRPEEVQVEVEGEETASNFRAIQIDPAREDSAGPKFIQTFDMDNDGLPDLVTGWNENQPMQLHLQRRSVDDGVSFVSVNLGGTSPLAIIGGVDVIDFDGDGWLDVTMLAKSTGAVGLCPKPGSDPPYELVGYEGEIQILFSPGNLEDIADGDAWQLVRLARSRLPGREDKSEQDARTFPEFNGYTGIAAGEIDGINGPDIVVAYNPVSCEFYGDDPPINRIELYANPGGANMFGEGTIPLAVIADAGPDQPIPAPDPDEEAPEPVEVTLDGSGSYSRFTDWLLGEVSYSWVQLSGPDVLLAGAFSEDPVFDAPITSTVLSFRVTVTAGDVTDYDVVNVVVGEPPNYPPRIVATSGDRTIIPDVEDAAGTIVEMWATATDPDGGNLTFTWEQVAGAPVALETAPTGEASFAAPSEAGELRFRVSVSDGTGYDSALVVIAAGVWAPIRIDGNIPRVSDVHLSDVDLDGDNDVLYTYPDAITSNVSWARNPMIAHSEGGPDGAGAVHAGFATWEYRPVGQVNTWADVFTLGDVDLDGFDDVLVRSRDGRIVQWFRHPGAADLEPIFPPPDVVPDRLNFPWQVYTMAEYQYRDPAGVAIGDLTGDGFNEVIIAAGGVIYWYDASLVESSYESWGENYVIDDTKAQGTTDDPDDADFIDAGTIIYALAVVDVDGDGFDDVIATFDRRTLSGLNEDTLLWFRNTLGEQGSDGDGE